MALRVTQHASLDDPALSADWERLSDRSPQASLFTTHAWCVCWAQTLGRHVEVAVLTVRDDRNETIGLLPACIERVGGVRWLKQLGRERACGDHLEPLCAPNRHNQCLQALIGYLEHWKDFHGLVLGELAPDSPTLRGVMEWATQVSCPFFQREQRVAPYVDLPETFDRYLAMRSANMRYHVRRRRRNLAKMADVSIQLHRGVASVDDALTQLFRLHQRRWRHDGQNGVLTDPAKQAFLRRFCRMASRRDWVRIYQLQESGHTHCVLLAFHWNGTASFYQMGWDPHSPVPSPGVVVMAESIEQAVRERMTRYDFLRGDEAYKRRWASQSARLTTLVVGCRWQARAAMAAERLKDRFKATILRSLGDAQWQRMKRLAGGLSR
ncbi:MAG: GNAT family N-acetyltransferase [Phycisphaerae bacterium]